MRGFVLALAVFVCAVSLVVGDQWSARGNEWRRSVTNDRDWLRRAYGKAHGAKQHGTWRHDDVDDDDDEASKPPKHKRPPHHEDNEDQDADVEDLDGELSDGELPPPASPKPEDYDDDDDDKKEKVSDFDVFIGKMEDLRDAHKEKMDQCEKDKEEYEKELGKQQEQYDFMESELEAKREAIDAVNYAFYYCESVLGQY